ncbi:hypothetical protein BJ912DRAFT_1043337 [Pholiota molesta]|nr:hypothetical protein BJ912DRAFT_1043337 [Pholiota molesta]
MYPLTSHSFIRPPIPRAFDPETNLDAMEIHLLRLASSISDYSSTLSTIKSAPSPAPPSASQRPKPSSAPDSALAGRRPSPDTLLHMRTIFIEDRKGLLPNPESPLKYWTVYIQELTLRSLQATASPSCCAALRSDLNEDDAILTKDRWPRTRDIGQRNEVGTLKVAGRATQAILQILCARRQLLRLRQDTSQPIAIHRPTQTQPRWCPQHPDTSLAELSSYPISSPTSASTPPIAIIDPRKSDLAYALGILDAALGEPCADAHAQKAILDQCNVLARKGNNGFARMTMLADAVLTAEDGLLMAAQKAHRVGLAEKFEKEIDEEVKERVGN